MAWPDAMAGGLQAIGSRAASTAGRVVYHRMPFATRPGVVQGSRLRPATARPALAPHASASGSSNAPDAGSSPASSSPPSSTPSSSNAPSASSNGRVAPFRPPHPLDPFQRLSAKSEVLNQLLERRAARLREDQALQQAGGAAQQQQQQQQQGRGELSALPNGAVANGAATVPGNSVTIPPGPSAVNGAVPSSTSSSTSSSSNGAGVRATSLSPREGGGSTALAPPLPSGGSSAGRRTTKVRFWLKFKAEWGQRLKVVGSDEALGAWQLEAAPELKWSEGDNWHATLDLAAGMVCEYKYVLLDHSGRHAVAWQQGNNSVLALRVADDFVEVFDNWGGDPGAKVVADGGVPATRENRLLAWATEIEAQVASQRQELRRARMELAAAQEDARMARMEAAQAKEQLAESEAGRVAAVAQAAAATHANRLLQQQLAEMNVGFCKALETAASILSQIDSQPAAPSSSGSGASGANGDSDAAAKKPRATRRRTTKATATASAADASAAEAPAAEQAPAAAAVAAKLQAAEAAAAEAAAAVAGASSSGGTEDQPKPKRKYTRRKATAAASAEGSEEGSSAAAAGAKTTRTRRARSKAAAGVSAGEAAAAQDSV